MYMTEKRLEIKELEDNIKSHLSAISPDERDGLVSAITKLIEYKLKEAVDDLEDQINQRGVYDPDY